MTAPSAAGALSRNYKASVLLAWLLTVALALGVIARTPFVADLSAFLPASADERQRVLVDQLRSGAAARTLLVGIDGGSAEQRVLASKALAKALRASGLFEQVQNGEQDSFADVGAWLFEHRYQLSPAVNAERFTVAGLRDAMAESLSLLGTPAGNAIKPLLHQDPTGETQRIAEGLLPAHAPRNEDGVWVAREAPRALLLLGIRAAGADLDAMAAAINQVRSSFAQLAPAGLALRLSGTPLFSVDSRAQIETEIRWLAISGTLMVSALLLLAFGSLPALLVAQLPVITGVLTGIAAVGLGFGNVHGVTLGFGATLIGEAVDYAIYYLIQARGGAKAAAANGERGWQHWLRHSWPTVRLGLLTSICGFAALIFSGFPGLAQLGLFSMSGLIGAALTTRFLMPVLMPDGARGVGLRQQLGRWAAAAVAFLPRLRRGLLALGVLAAAGLLWQRGEIWSADLASLSPVPRAALDLDAALRAELTASAGGSLVVVRGPDLETTLQRAEAAALRLDALVDAGVIGGYNSVTRWLPSQATQRQRLASIPDAVTLRAALAQATAGGPLKAERLQPFLDAAQAARQRAAVGPESLRGTALAPLVDALLMRRDDGSWAALLPLQATAGASQEQAVRQALLGASGALWLDVVPELDRLYQHYLGEAQVQAALGALGVLLLVALWLRSWHRLLAVVRPLLLAVLITLGGLAVLQVPLGILHLVGLLLVVAVGSNYALFFDMLQHEGTADADTLASLLLANLTTVLAFGLIALSGIPALSAIGRVVAPGALLALALAAAFAGGVRAPASRPGVAIGLGQPGASL